MKFEAALGLVISGALANLTCTSPSNRDRAMGRTEFRLTNNTAETLLYGTSDPHLQGIIEPGWTATVPPFSSGHSCDNPAPVTSVQCLQLFRGKQLVCQITPVSSERWTLRMDGPCQWVYERSIDAQDVELAVPDSVRCR